ncbi:MAG TPA: hypothetical protein VJ830_00680 [Anaerolineales bacterium]|nr:hypothetical protein [Anaerolineales bacterium]
MRKRLPEFQSIVQVYAVIAVLFAGWTITAFLWKLSAWLLLLNLGEVFTIFSYAMAANFLESLSILLLLLIACSLLPARVLRDEFVVRGTILSAGIIGSLMVFVGSQMYFGIERGVLLLIAPLSVLILTAFLLQRASKLHQVRSIAVLFSDRVVVFLFILLPLFAVASIYVLFRNTS